MSSNVFIRVGSCSPVTRHRSAPSSGLTAFLPLQAAAAATLVAAQPALASQEVAQVAADNRLLALGGILVPALGWVAFNAASPAFRQLDEMGEKAAERDGKVRRGAPPPQKKTRGRR